MPGRLRQVLDIFRTPTFRLASISGGAFSICVVVLFAFIYWQTSIHETSVIDRFVVHEAQTIAQSPADEIARQLAWPQASDTHRVAYAALFDADKHLILGNLGFFPANLPLDGQAHRVRILANDEDGAAIEIARAAAVRLPDGHAIVIARDVEDLEELQHAVLRALELGVIPAIFLALAVGALLSWRALKRVRTVHMAAERILQGNLRERLPFFGTEDDFDRLAAAVNRMLDEIERLLDEVKGVGDDIAHDLRTPLTRVRTRLERGRKSASKEELRDTVTASIAGLDQALAIITALLRITEIEDGRRRAGFKRIDLAAILRDALEFYGPIAETHGVTLTLDAPAPRWVQGDRELLHEAIANILDNAIKFTPGGNVALALGDQAGDPNIRVTDKGPGIPIEEREAVLKRFYRSDKSRHLPGNGLGLNLVAAIVQLHKFRIQIGDANPGCVFEIICEADPAPARWHARAENESV